MHILQTVCFAYIFNYCIVTTQSTVDNYYIRDILRGFNNFEVSDTLSRMFPNNNLRSNMAIQIDDVDYNTQEKDTLSIGDLNLNKQQKEVLRRRWRSSCDKKAAKVCMKACKITYKSVCSSFKCKRSMKRSFKKECKSNCKAKFLSSQYSDGE